MIVRPLKKEDWPTIETLFGERGACGGCWCMYWRLPRGGKLWEENKGENNKQAFKELVESGKVTACLAFHNNAPVGWCCFGPRSDFPRLQRTKALQTDWSEKTWSVVCFYIPAKWRGKGVATALLKGAIETSRSSGAFELEAYPAPSKWAKKGKIPAAFAWTGTLSLFRKAGFMDITPPGNSRPVLKLEF